MIALLFAAVARGQDAPPEAMVCAGCHGADGNSASATWPKLAGQPPGYIEKQLWNFKAGVRTDPSMAGIAAGLDENGIRAVAAWFSASPRAATPPARVAPAVLQAGERLYQHGDPARGLAPCRACHGPEGFGGQDARGNAFPALAGQHADYLERQLASFANGERHNDPGGMMSLIATRTSAAEQHAVAAYLAQLPVQR